MNRTIEHFTINNAAPSSGTNQTTTAAWLSRSFWFIAVCGFVTGGFAALGQRGEDLAARDNLAAATSPANANASGKKRWKAPPPVSQQVATVAGQIPLAAPTARPTAVLPLKDNVESAPGPTTGKTAVVLLLLGVLGGAALLLGKKKTGFGATKIKQMEVVETIRVAGRHQLCLVRAAGRLLVLGTSEKGLTLLTTLEGADLDHVAGESPATAGQQSEFHRILAAAQEPAPPIHAEPREQPVPRPHVAQSAVGQGHAQADFQTTRRAAVAPEPPRRRFINAHAFAEQTRQEPSSTTSRDVFLDHLVNRLNAATPNALRDVVDAVEPTSHLAGPIARYRSSLA